MFELAKVKRILVIKPSSLGDILHVFPALAELRIHCPEATLDFLIHPAFADILDYSPFPVSERILFERKRMGRVSTMVPEFLKLVRELRRKKYDLVIDFQGLTRSALFASLTRGGPVVGFAQTRETADSRPRINTFYLYSNHPFPLGLFACPVDKQITHKILKRQNFLHLFS